MTDDVIILTALNLFWAYVWYNVGKFIGRKEKEDEQDD